MTYFRNLNIGGKLLAAFAAVLLLAVCTGGFAIEQLAEVNRATAELGERWMPNSRAAQQLRYDLVRLRTTLLQHLLAGGEAEKAKWGKIVAGAAAAVARDVEACRLRAGSVEEGDAVRELADLWKAQQAQDVHVLEASSQGRTEAARALLLGKSASTAQAIAARAEALALINSDGAQAAAEGAARTYLAARRWIAGVLLACVLLGVALALWMARMVARPLRMAVEVAERVAAGDLRARLEVTGRDETAQLMRALRDMNASLGGIVADVRGGTEAMAMAAGEIAAGNADLSSRTEAQASALEQTAASMEELTGNVRDNAASAREASALAGAAADVARRGGGMVAEVVQTMAAINDASRQVAEITGVIDGIAFQTNILALNAAVEAARAGEQGRGFAVVASEVRSLAQRSASAAGDIKRLLQASVARADAGHRLVGQTGATMAEIVGSVERVSAIMQDINAASAEQAAGIEQVNQAITSMDEVTQQNAALVEQAAAAAQAMQDQAAALQRAVGAFQLAGAPSRQGGG